MPHVIIPDFSTFVNTESPCLVSPYVSLGTQRLSNKINTLLLLCISANTSRRPITSSRPFLLTLLTPALRGLLSRSYSRSSTRIITLPPAHLLLMKNGFPILR
jgi:hypothetical protein